MSDSTTRSPADDEWEGLLNQWRAQQNTQLRPFFYNRVRARLVGEAAVEYQPLHMWLRWSKYAVMLGILILSGDGAVAHSTKSVSHPQFSPEAQHSPFSTP